MWHMHDREPHGRDMTCWNREENDRFQRISWWKACVRGASEWHWKHAESLGWRPTRACSASLTIRRNKLAFLKVSTDICKKHKDTWWSGTGKIAGGEEARQKRGRMAEVDGKMKRGFGGNDDFDPHDPCIKGGRWDENGLYGWEWWVLMEGCYLCVREGAPQGWGAGGREAHSPPLLLKCPGQLFKLHLLLSDRLQQSRCALTLLHTLNSPRVREGRGH